MNTSYIHKTNKEKIQNLLSENIQAVEIHDETWGNYIYEINNKWIFKFPRRKESIPLFEKEKDILQKFSRISPLPVPVICFETADCFGYEKIIGEPFSQKIFDALSEMQQEKIAKAFSSFLKTFHAFQCEKIETHSFRFKKFREIILPAVMTKMSQSAQKKAQIFFDAFYANPHYQETKNVLIHADLREANIFFNQEHGMISGIIDFGDACIGDMAYEYGKLLFVYGAKFMRKILHYATHPFDAHFLARVDFYEKAQPFDIIYWNQQRKRRHDVKWAMKRLEKMFSQPVSGQE